MKGREMAKKKNESTGLIALATIFDEGHITRGRIPAPVVKALKAKGGDVVAFERTMDGKIVVRKSTATERKSHGKGSQK
jgi:bifunctional DNA-binding transcriptional regulator/antitoxin component of YhaV-PrlF toxin-antitoxin module